MATTSSESFSYQHLPRLGVHANASPRARGDPRLPPTLMKATAHLYSQAQRPKLRYLFDEAIHRERANRLGRGEAGALPVGFPARVEGPRCWTGEDFRDESSYAVTFDASEIDEIEHALSFYHSNGDNLGPGQVNPETFPLPTLGPKLRAMATTVFSGRGFVLMRGLDPERYSSVDNMIISNGITGYIAEVRGAQDEFGNMVVHMKDMESSISAPLRPTYTQDALPFHNDAAELIAMYGIRSAASGGHTTFASASRIYNDLAESRPDVLRLLSEPNWKYPDEIEPLGYSSRPLLHPCPKNSPYFFFSRRRLTGLPNIPLASHVPPMSERQAEALDVFELTARRHSFAVKLRAGDLFVFHNLAMVHGREAFENSPGKGKGGEGKEGRHIMRTFLMNRERSWRPPALTEAWVRLYADREVLARAVWKTAEDVEVKHIVTDGDTCV